MAREFYKPVPPAVGQFVQWTDMPNPMCFTFDNTQLVPAADTRVESRTVPDTSVKFGPYLLGKPLVSSPMDTVSDEGMVRELHRLGGIGTLPRGDLETNLAICERLSNENVPCLYAIGLSDTVAESLSVARRFKERGAQMALINVAHGGMRRVGETAAEIQNKLDLWVVAGNIATYEQGLEYQQWGIRIARVGVGSGGVCTTPEATGVHVPQLSAIFGVSEVPGLYVIADGGMWTGGDLAKAIAAGATVGMFGSRFGVAIESPGARTADGKKIVRGQASASYMQDNGVSLGEFRAAEGVEVEVKPSETLEQIVNGLMGGLRSAMSYRGAFTLSEFFAKTRFIYVDAAAQQGAKPHLAFKT